MTFGEKLKKLRLDNNLTQETLAEKIYVTRTAISKWETDKGYPGIDSLKQLSSLFQISLDDLVSDVDVENKRLLDKAQSRKFYWCAIGCLAAATVCAVVYWFLQIPYLNVISTASVVGYVVFGLLSKPKYKRLEVRKMVVPYVVSRIVLLGVIITVIVCAFVQA